MAGLVVSVFRLDFSMYLFLATNGRGIPFFGLYTMLYVRAYLGGCLVCSHMHSIPAI